MRLRSITPQTMVATGIAGSLLFLVAALGVGLTDGGVLFLLFAALVPDGIRAWVRRPFLSLSAVSVTYHGWTVDARLAWADVAAVRLEPGYRPRLVVSGAPDATSWTCSTGRLLLPMEPRPRRPEITVLTLALDEPHRVATLVDSYRGLGEAGRASVIGPVGRRLPLGRASLRRYRRLSRSLVRG